MADVYIAGEKGEHFESYYDNDSAPIAQNVNTQPNYNQNQQNNLSKNQSTINPETSYYYAASENMPDENNMNNNSNTQKEIFSKCTIIRQYILAWILIGVSLIDILFQLIYWYINLYLMIDDIAILAISSVYLFYTFKRKKFNKLIGVLTIIIWFCGFGCKGFGLTQLNDRIKDNTIPNFLPMTLFLMVGVRSFTIFFYIPITCQ